MQQQDHITLSAFGSIWIPGGVKLSVEAACAFSAICWHAHFSLALSCMACPFSLGAVLPGLPTANCLDMLSLQCRVLEALPAFLNNLVHGCVCLAVTNASRTNLMDIATCTWHLPFLELFKAMPEMMPRIASNAEVYGWVAEGPLAGVPIAGELLLELLEDVCNSTEPQDVSCEGIRARIRP